MRELHASWMLVGAVRFGVLRPGSFETLPRVTLANVCIKFIYYKDAHFTLYENNERARVITT